MYDLSISIITYNRKNILRRVLDFLRVQTLVFVDDASTDGVKDDSRKEI